MRKTVCLLTLAFFYFYSVGNSQIDSLKIIVKTSKNDTTRYKALYKLAISHLDSAYEVSIAYWDQAIELAKRKRFWIMAADAHHQKGYMLYKKGELLNGLNNFKEALAIYEQVNGEKEMGEVLNDIGLVYRTWGKYELAIDNYLASLKIFNRINYDEGIGMASNNIGQIYFYRDDFLKAIDYFKKYLEINQKLKYSRAVAAASNNIATAYMELGSFDLAYTYFYKSLLIYDSLKINLGVAIIQDNIGSLYLKKNQHNDAILYHTQALQTFTDLGNLSYQCNTLKNIGLAYFKLAKFEKAKTFYQQSAKLAEKLNKAETLKEVFFNLAEAYESTKQHKEALVYFKKYLQVKDSLLTVETAEKLANLESKLDTEQQDRDLSNLKDELKTKQTYLKIGLSLILLFIPAFALILFLYFKNKAQKERLRNIASVVSDIDFLASNHQENILLQLNTKFKCFHQWHSNNNNEIKFGISTFFRGSFSSIILWQAEVETNLYMRLAAEGYILNKIEQMKNIQTNTLLNLFNAEIIQTYKRIYYNATNFIAFDHTNGNLTFSNNSIVLTYNHISTKLSVTKNENYSTIEGDNILVISVANNETLPKDFYINLESILQKHGNDENELLKHSLDGLFEMLEISNSSLTPIHFVTFKP